LIYHPGALGDVVVMFGLIAELKKHYRHLTLVCRPSAGYLATAFELVHQSLSQDTGPWSSLYGGRPDNRVIQLLKRQQQIIAFSISHELENRIRACTPVPCLRVRPRPPVNVDEHVAAVAARELIEKGLIRRKPPLTRALCRQTLPAQAGPARGRKAPTLLHPGAGSPRKRWPLENFLQLASGIGAAGDRPEMIIGPAETDILENIRPHGLHLHVLKDIGGLLRLLQTAAGFIGNDSGVAHLAACLGLPTTVIYTASDAKRWRPAGPAVATLSPELPCRPCFEIRSENCPEPDCLTAITPGLVLQTHYRQMEKRRADESLEE